MSTEDGAVRDVLAVAAAEPAAAERGDAEAYLALLADDAVYLAPNTPPKAGDDLRAWLRRFVEEASVEWLEYRDGPTIVAGDLAFHDYAYLWRVTTKRTGEAHVSRGKGIQIFSKQSDGSWRILRNIWNSDPGPG